MKKLFFIISRNKNINLDKNLTYTKFKSKNNNLNCIFSKGRLFCKKLDNYLEIYDDPLVSNLKIFIDNDEFVVQADQFSSRWIFYFKTANLFIISDSIDFIIEIASSNGYKLDIAPSAIPQVIQSSYIYQTNSTYITGINKIDSGIKMNLCLKSFRSSFKKTNFEKFCLNNQQQKFNLKNVSRLIEDKLLDNLSKLKNKKIAIMQSAGLDSRLILLLCLKAGIKPDLITFGQSTVNKSDFYVSSLLASHFNLNLIPFRIDSNNIKKNDEFLSASNYSNLWMLAKLPKEFFEYLKNYDYLLRGDGDGLFGWKDGSANLNDMLHRLEITPISYVFDYLKNYLEDKSTDLMSLYINASEIYTFSRNLKKFNVYNSGYFYRIFRQENLISSHISTLNKFSNIYNPLLDQYVLNQFDKLEGKYKFDKSLLRFLTKKLELELSSPVIEDNIGPSWNNNIDNFLSKTNKIFEKEIKDQFNYSENYSIKTSRKKTIFFRKVFEKFKKIRIFRFLAIFLKLSKPTPSFSYDSGYRLYALAKLKKKING
ncbi:hypothetical protein EU99_1811 [Prochlorococcus marinus str. MIT 9321]|uniref:Asparagine synthetase domain-containing protein n=1 Tax=Prochlorococcus marinus str. MIT 9401 TaxID=167551 RepID=A0A0A2B9H1_PROMR|nr:hypothetical protein [Prochlorococcus marinus]KGG02849.1 hypothetical protein EU99_1811 [Prochlorococcus marinus str. MIT 9321]KGG05472.1 hypothetical protein EV00_1106 [Prochlorococcus marinus str. MIT 9322]KGG10506.1 hypothetical protein EV01_0134 [Prochlorococcus marinus str. MIT 9401]